jgi:hypothetical protein
MPRDARPQIGAWYETDEGEVFTVLALDLKSNAIDVQYASGTVDMFDLGTWRNMDVQQIDAPDGWYDAMDYTPPRRRRSAGE